MHLLSFQRAPAPNLLPDENWIPRVQAKVHKLTQQLRSWHIKAPEDPLKLLLQGLGFGGGGGGGEEGGMDNDKIAQNSLWAEACL